MQRRVSAIVTAAVGAGVSLVFIAAAAGQTGDLAKGASLLADARKAIGGEDKLAAIKRLQVNGTMRRGQGNINLDGDSEVFFELPDKFRRNESLSLGVGGPGIDRVEVLNGNDVWDETSGGGGGGRGADFGGRGGRGGNFGGGGGGGRGIGDLLGAARGDAAGQGGQQIDPERLREAQRRARHTEVVRLLLAILLKTDAPAAWIGTAQSPDGTADVLEVSSPDGVTTRLLLDSATHMPLMLTWPGAAQRAGGGRAEQGRGRNPAGAPDQAQRRGGRGAQGGPPSTIEMHLAEFKAVNGIKLPHLITRGTSGETSEEWEIKNYKVNPNFKANTFTK